MLGGLSLTEEARVPAAHLERALSGTTGAAHRVVRSWCPKVWRGLRSGEGLAYGTHVCPATPSGAQDCGWGRWPRLGPMYTAASLLITATPSGPQLMRRQQGSRGCYQLIEEGFTWTTKARFSPPALGPRLYGSPVPMGHREPVGQGEWEALARGLEVRSGRSAALGSPPGPEPRWLASQGAWEQGRQRCAARPGGGRAKFRPFPHWVRGCGPDGHVVWPLETESQSGSLPTSQFRGNPRPTRLLKHLQGPPFSLPVPAEGSRGALLPWEDSSGTSEPTPQHLAQWAPWPVTHSRPTCVGGGCMSVCM